MSATETVRREYDRLAPRYDSRWKRYVARSAAATLDHVRLAPGGCVLDLGSGTGVLMRELVRRFRPRLGVALDLSFGMLEVARERLEETAHVARGDAQHLPFADSVFDCVVSASSFHYWSEPRKALAEIARVLRPGGELVLTDWCDDFVACRICDRILRLRGSSYRRIYGSEECLELLRAGGFAPSEPARYKVSFLWGLMTVRARALQPLEVPAEPRAPVARP